MPATVMQMIAAATACPATGAIAITAAVTTASVKAAHAIQPWPRQRLRCALGTLLASVTKWT